MRILKLQIKDREYKNLDIDLQGNSSGIMAFIGNNGSGKSNLLESLCIIFHHFYNRKEKEIPFNFSISYKNSGSTEEIEISKNRTNVKTTIDGKTVSDPYDRLPKQIIAIYSGEEDRLWRKWFRPVYLDYIANITGGKSSGIGVYNEMPKMLYINKFYWHISLLCLLLQRFFDENDRFCDDVLSIKNVHTVKFKFNKDNYKNYADSNVKQFIQLIDKKEEYTLEEFFKIIELNYTISEVYKFLYIAFTPDTKKMLQDIVIKYNDENLEIEDFSEGEKKMLLIKAALEFAGAEDSLYILDEPDAHIHLNNKVQIKKVFENYSDHRQVVLTTHSPTLTDTFDEDSLYMLNQGKLVPQKKQEILENVSGEFWNKHQQNAFIASKKPIILLVEGAEDKIHLTNAIEKLKDEYDIPFDIFNMGGADNIEHFVKGIYSSELKIEKLIICILDVDDKGSEIFKELNIAFKNIPNYVVMPYPKKQINPHHEGAFTVENMFQPQLYENAYKEIIQDFSFEYKSIDKISKNIQTKAKGRLAGLSSGFEKDDFKNFRFVFDKIKDHYKNYLQTSEDRTKVENPQKETSVPNIAPADNTASTGVSGSFKIYTNKRNTEVKGEYFTVSGKIVIKAGSKLSRDTVSSYGASQEKDRKSILRKKTEVQEQHYLLKEDIMFKSPSGAINFATGGNMNGWHHWLIEDTNEPLETIKPK